MTQEHPLLCPQCLKIGKKSMVFGETPWEQIGDYLPEKEYYDETGKRHVHDPNRVVSGWKCSNAHRFRWYVRAGCIACAKVQDHQFEILPSIPPSQGETSNG